MNRIGIDIFAGAGGLSLGAEMAGISIAHAIETLAQLRHIKEIILLPISYARIFEI